MNCNSFGNTGCPPIPCKGCTEQGDASKSASLACSTDGGPLTANQRVDRLFDINEFPTYEEIVSVIRDAEFDTLNFPEMIAKRHGM